MKIGRRIFDTDNGAYIMGILNVTPDSFSDGGKYNSEDKALEHALSMIGDGADLLDIGGESTRPGYEPVSAKEEQSRIVPVIRRIRSVSDIPISVDTTKAEVAKEALLAGADMINDISCLTDPDMPGVIADTGCAYCLMHNREIFEYADFRRDVLNDLKAALKRLDEAGVNRAQIVIDPGVGFAKTIDQNLQVLKYIKDFHSFGLPVLLGTSRKSVIGKTLDLPVDERMVATVATTVYGFEAGCSFFRVHDVKENRQALDMIRAIRNVKDEG